MKITAEEVRTVLELAYLNHGETDTSAIAGHLAKMFERMEDINQVNVEGVEPFFNLSFRDLPIQDDVISVSMSAGAIVSTFREQEEGYLSVKKVVAKGDH